MTRKERVDRWMVDVMTKIRSTEDRYIAVDQMHTLCVRFNLNQFGPSDLTVMSDAGFDYGLLVIHWYVNINLTNQCISVTVFLDESHEPELDRFAEARYD